MSVTGIALVSGGLDSICAVKVLQEQGINIIGIAFETPFFGAGRARKAAEEIGIPLVVLTITDDHLAMLRAPRYGYGKNLNPCIDCHILMVKKAGDIMKERGGDFVSTGEVLGQRPMSQGKQSLHIVASRSGYDGYVLRPLSARLLPATIPEEEGRVDRERLLDIQGRSRKRQLAMAAHYGITSYSSPAGGCLLTDPVFARRMRDLFAQRGGMETRDIELLKTGRHLRLSDDIKIIVGRKEGENKILEHLAEGRDSIIWMRDFPGPTVLVPGGCGDDAVMRAAAICALYSDAPADEEVVALCRRDDSSFPVTVTAAVKDEVSRLII